MAVLEVKILNGQKSAVNASYMKFGEIYEREGKLFVMLHRDGIYTLVCLTPWDVITVASRADELAEHMGFIPTTRACLDVSLVEED